MTKSAKELILVFLTGAGVLTVLWGIFAQFAKASSSLPGVVKGHVMWNAVGAGAALIVVAVAIGFLVRARK